MLILAKGKFEYYLTAEGLNLLQDYARNGLIDEEIAKKMNITTSTLYEWKKRFPEISEALKKGKAVVDAEVEQALYKKCLAGDTTAIIFWLKNRRGKLWREKQELDVEQSVAINFKDDIHGN